MICRLGSKQALRPLDLEPSDVAFDTQRVFPLPSYLYHLSVEQECLFSKMMDGRDRWPQESNCSTYHIFSDFGFDCMGQ